MKKKVLAVTGWSKRKERILKIGEGSTRSQSGEATKLS